MQINQALLGKEFTTKIDPNTVWKIEGFTVSGTFLVLGSTWDQASNRSRLHLHNLKDIEFKGKI